VGGVAHRTLHDEIDMKKKILVMTIALVSVTVLWTILLNVHLQAFESYKENWVPPVDRPSVKPYFGEWWNWGNGYLLASSAFGILIGLVFLLKTFWGAKIENS